MLPPPSDLRPFLQLWKQPSQLIQFGHPIIGVGLPSPGEFQGAYGRAIQAFMVLEGKICSPLKAFSPTETVAMEQIFAENIFSGGFQKIASELTTRGRQAKTVTEKAKGLFVVVPELSLKVCWSRKREKKNKKMKIELLAAVKRTLDSSPKELWTLGRNMVVGVVFFPKAQHYFTADSLPLHFYPSHGHFTRVECQDPSQFFQYSNRIKFWPFNFLTDLENKMIVDNSNISRMDFAYLVACLHIILIYKSKHHIYAWFYKQLGYNHQFLEIVDLQLLANMSLIEENVLWRECMHHKTNSTLDVPSNYLLRIVSITYGHWWHKIARGGGGGTCVAIHLLASPSLTSKGQKRGTGILLSDLRNFTF